MAGKEKSAKRLAKHLGTEVDAACAISRPGSIEARLARSRRGNVVGATAVGMAADRAGAEGEINAGVISWLAIGPDGFSITRGGSQLGRPKGPPIAQFAYGDVEGVQLTPGDMTTRSDIQLKDGRLVSFESSTSGANAINAEVLELLRARCV